VILCKNRCFIFKPKENEKGISKKYKSVDCALGGII